MFYKLIQFSSLYRLNNRERPGVWSSLAVFSRVYGTHSCQSDVKVLL